MKKRIAIALLVAVVLAVVGVYLLTPRVTVRASMDLVSISLGGSTSYSLPAPSSLGTMDWYCKAQPHVDVPAQGSVHIETMDWYYRAQPFVSNYSIAVPAITNTQDTWNIGHVQVGYVRYFSADNTEDGDWAMVTNTGNVAVDVQIQGLDMEGGDYGWILGSSAGNQTYSLYTNSEANPMVYDIEVKKSDYNNLCTNLGVADAYYWSMMFTAPTVFNASDDGAQKSTTITLVAVAF